jgi:hypothetical protein
MAEIHHCKRDTSPVSLFNVLLRLKEGPWAAKWPTSGTCIGIVAALKNFDGFDRRAGRGINLLAPEFHI